MADMKSYSRAENIACRALKRAGFCLIGYDFKLRMNSLYKGDDPTTIYYVDSWQDAAKTLL